MSNSIFSKKEIEELIHNNKDVRGYGETPEEIFLYAVDSCKNGEINNIKNGLCFPFDKSRSIFGPEKESTDLTPEEKKIILGRENDEGILEKQLLLEKFLVDSICAFYEIDRNKLKMIRQYKDVTEDKVEEQDKKIYEEIKDKIKDVNSLFNNCIELFDNKKLEDILKEREGKKTSAEPAKAPKDKIAQMITEGKGSCKMDINGKSYLFSDPETVFKKCVANSLNEFSNIKDYTNNGIAIINNINNKEHKLSDEDYKVLYGDQDQIKSADKAAITLSKDLQINMTNSICNFYNINPNALVNIVKTKKNGYTLDGQQETIFNCLYDCHALMTKKKEIEEINEEGKEYTEVKGTTWTDTGKRIAYAYVNHDPKRENLDYEQISIEELTFRLKECTGRTPEQIFASLKQAVDNQEDNSKIRLNDALFGTGKFGGKGAKKVKRVNKLHEWLISIGAKRAKENSIREENSDSKLKPYQRTNAVIDRARGLFNAYLNRMIILNPGDFEKAGILGIKKGYFARNLERTRRFSSRWIKESFNFKPKLKGKFSFFFAKPTKNAFFEAITDVYTKTPGLKEALANDKAEVELTNKWNNKYQEFEVKSKDINLEDQKYAKRKKEATYSPDNPAEEEFQNKILKRDALINKLNKEAIALQGQNQDLQGQLGTAKAQNTQLQSNLEKAQEQNTQLQSNLEKAQEQNTQLQSNLEKAQTEKKQAVEDALKQANEKAEAEKKQAVKVKEQEIEVVQQQSREKDEQIAQLQGEKQALKTQADAAEAIKQELNGLKQEKGKFNGQKDTISKILAKYQGEQNEINISNEDFNNLKNCLAAMGIAQQTERQ